MASVKHSRQRDAVLAELQSRMDHPTAEELYFSLKNEMPNLSLSTVYRNLNMLVSDGVIKKISLGNADRYDGCNTLHYHFLCLKCGKVNDIDMPPFDNINQNVQKYAKEQILSHEILFSGVCKECSEA